MTQEERKALSEISYELGKEIRTKFEERFKQVPIRKLVIKLTEHVILNQKHKVFKMIALLAAQTGVSIPKCLIDSYEDEEYFAITSRAFLTGFTWNSEKTLT